MTHVDTNQFYDPFEREERDLSIENIENMRVLYVLNFLSKGIIIKNSHKYIVLIKHVMYFVLNFS